MIEKDADFIAAEFKDYAYRVSHDLGAPIRLMVEFSKLLKTEHAEALDADAREYLTFIIENGQKLQTMMDGLLQYSRLNKAENFITSVQIDKILEQCLFVMDQQITATGAKISLAGAIPKIDGDSEQIMQLFIALIDNALKFQPKGHVPEIIITAEDINDFCQFSIADNGIGIAPQYYDKIYKIFSRLHNDDVYLGVGMGLTLAEKIVQRHGGKIWVEPNTDKGSIFKFTLHKNNAMLHE